MKPDNSTHVNLSAIRFSLCLKVVITLWAFYYAVTSDDASTGILYLVVSILFAGLFVFQLDFYRKKKAGRESSKNDSEE